MLLFLSLVKGIITVIANKLDFNDLRQKRGQRVIFDSLSPSSKCIILIFEITVLSTERRRERREMYHTSILFQLSISSRYTALVLYPGK